MSRQAFHPLRERTIAVRRPLAACAMRRKTVPRIGGLGGNGRGGEREKHQQAVSR